MQSNSTTFPSSSQDSDTAGDLVGSIRSLERRSDSGGGAEMKNRRRKGRSVSTIEPAIKERKKICKRSSHFPCWLIESLPEEEQTEFFGTAAIKNGGFWE